MDLLLKIGFIKKEKGKYIQSSPFLSTGPEVKSFAVLNFHKEMAKLAIDAMDRFPKNERNNTACTIQVSDEGFNKIKSKMNDFRKEVLSLAEADKNINSQRVYHTNFQFFPVSVKPSRKEN